MPPRLHLWLLALGLGLTFSRFGRPTDQGLTERSHQLWTDQVITGQTCQDWEHLYLALQDWRTFRNEDLPCRSLGEQSPLTAFPQARHSGRFYCPHQETDLLDLQPVYDYLAQGRCFRLISQSGTFSLGGHVFFVSTKFARPELEITFDPSDHHLLCRLANRDLVSRLPVRFLAKNFLIGSFAHQFHLPHFQLPLPLDFSAQRVLRLSAVLEGMTFCGSTMMNAEWCQVLKKVDRKRVTSDPVDEGEGEQVYRD